MTVPASDPARLQRVLAALEPADAAWLAEVIARARAGSGRALGQALGPQRRGGTSAHHAARLAQRDELLRQLHRDHFPGHTSSQAAAEIDRLPGRLNGMAVRAADARLRAFQEIVEVAGRIPGRRQLRTILAGNSVGRLNFPAAAEPCPP